MHTYTDNYAYEHGNGSKWLTFTPAVMEVVFGLCNLQTQFIFLIH